jgi:hypothetical protein
MRMAVAIDSPMANPDDRRGASIQQPRVIADRERLDGNFAATNVPAPVSGPTRRVTFA